MGDVSDSKVFYVGVYTVLGLVSLGMTLMNMTTNVEELLTVVTAVFAACCALNIVLEFVGPNAAKVAKVLIAFRNITECRKEGIRIAIDDFGTGNSSFGDIGDYPVDELKVDREIILKTGTERGSALLQGLIGLAHQLGIEVVCEGVETDGQRDCAVENGTDFIQGYFYSYVFPVEEGKRHYKASLAQ